MASGRTPVNQRPGTGHQKPTGSRTKLIPRCNSGNRKQDANATVSCFKSHNASEMGPQRYLSHTARQNLDVTLLGAAHPNIKSSIGLSSIDNELEYDLAYTDYLQALMKRQLVKKTIEEHELKVKDQVMIQCEKLHEMENTFKDISNQIEGLKEQGDTIELLQTWKHGVSELETFCSKYNTLNRLSELEKVLIKESNLVSIKNIKPISSQEEYDELISSLNNLKDVMQKIVTGDKNFGEVNELAASMKAFKEFDSRIRKSIQKLSRSNERAGALILQESSDFFAKQGGYY